MLLAAVLTLLGGGKVAIVDSGFMRLRVSRSKTRRRTQSKASVLSCRSNGHSLDSERIQVASGGLRWASHSAIEEVSSKGESGELEGKCSSSSVDTLEGSRYLKSNVERGLSKGWWLRCCRSRSQSLRLSEHVS